MPNLELDDLTPEERAREEHKANVAELRRAVGSRCELRSQDNNLIFIGRALSFDGIALTIISESGRDLPPVIFNTEFKMTIRAIGQQALVWRGSICGSSPKVWKLDHLVRFHYAEHRSHFRQPISIPGMVIAMQNPLTAVEGTPVPCTVLDISLGGMQMRCAERYERSTWLLISDTTLSARQGAPFTFTGQVCWADRAGANAFLYGLRFATMGMRDQDRLCSAIFTLQRMDLQAHRD